ncbi:Serpentine Receptor, class T [Caenorhabditis elegans]|uniref:Serpentine Receptor, class T n=1 Tax=Caenorhabditis elegans TaxID=6239 RepID=Q58AA2_CAEEL|nr:Serpentine Receptor, class T [Caenorhabditis elegans]CAI70404.1 Serpentine Receptor, class T [Caenorhabditis elegans]|eukprot:NP_001021368.1 Serpentine Receptor, class XA [Caenorhabditis elegans]
MISIVRWIVYGSYTLVLIFSTTFLIFFYWTIRTYKKNDKLPTIYIYTMILCNFGLIFRGFLDGVIPEIISKDAYYWFHNPTGIYLNVFNDFVYYFPMTLTILTLAHRIYLVFFPIGKAFDSEYLKWYCFAFSMMLLTVMLIPFFSACAGSFDYYLFAFRSGCPPKVHWITQFLASYFWIVPVVCMVLNIILIFHMSLKSKKNNQMSQNSASARQAQERRLLIQSIALTTFILSHEIASFITELYIEEFFSLPELTQRAILCGRAAVVDLVCFFIYFIVTPSTRRILLEKTNTVNGKKNSVTRVKNCT